MDPAQLDRLIDALNRMAAASEAWNAQQQRQWDADRAMIEEAKVEGERQRAEFARQLGGVPIVGQPPYRG